MIQQRSNETIITTNSNVLVDLSLKITIIIINSSVLDYFGARSTIITTNSSVLVDGLKSQ